MHKHGILQRNAGLFDVGLRTIDVGILVGTGMLTFWLRHPGSEFPSRYLAVMLSGAIIQLLLFPLFRIYDSWRGAGLWKEVTAISKGCGLTFGILTVIFFATKSGASLSRLWYANWFFAAWTGLVIFHVSIRSALRWMRRRGYNHRRLLLIGETTECKELIQRLEKASWAGLEISGCITLDYLQLSIEGVRVLGSLDELEQFLEQTGIDQVWVLSSQHQTQQIKEILLKVRNTADVYVMPPQHVLALFQCPLREIAGMQMIRINSSLRNEQNLLLKRAMDLCSACLFLVVLSPVMGLIALGVKLSSPGPVLFRQMRHGVDGDPIEIWKFRTMYVHQEAPGQLTQAAKHDSRVSPFGALLRSSSLDELPQLINVLQGRMSLVGPRPHAVEHNRYYQELIQYYHFRHKVRPGLTGWAQVNGLRGETKTLDKMQSRVEHDLYYIENWSLWMDLKILVLTLACFVNGTFSETSY